MRNNEAKSESTCNSSPSSSNASFVCRPLLRSPLHSASERGLSDIIRLFVDNGADPNFCDK